MESNVLQVLAGNVEALRAHKPELSSQAALAKAAGINQRTVGRLLAQEVAVGVDTLQGIAAAFEVKPWQLLVPGVTPERMPALVTDDLFSAQFSDAGRELAQRFDRLPNDPGKQRLFLDMLQMIDECAQQATRAASLSQPDAAPSAPHDQPARTPPGESRSPQPAGNTARRR